MSPQVVVVGSFVQDLSFRCTEFPSAGETVIGTFATGPGGKGSNQAVAAGRAGVPTLFVGAVGRDTFAADAKKFYASEGIRGHFVEKPKHATGSAAILLNSAGQNEIIVALGANAALKPQDVPAAALRQARVVLTQHETDLRTVTSVLKSARAAGAVTVHNPAPMRADFTPSLLQHADILIPNETEFVALINLRNSTRRAAAQTKPFRTAALNAFSDDELHARCRELGPKTVIVTLGARGVFVSQSSGHAFIPAYKVKVVDTTGAGDAFCGGFAAGLVKFSGDVLAAARFGNAVAALSVTKSGTAPAMPTEKEIRRFLAKR